MDSGGLTCTKLSMNLELEVMEPCRGLTLVELNGELTL